MDKQTFQQEELSSIPQATNPFLHDAYHMGTPLGENVMIMHENHPDKPCKYIIIVDIPSGRRLKVYFKT
jgi:hypothetical protein